MKVLKKKKPAAKKAVWTGGTSKFKPIMLVKIYELAKSGMLDGNIAKVLKIKPEHFFKWVKKKPEVAQALAMGREYVPGEGVKVYKDFVYGKLPYTLKKKWDKIMEFHKANNFDDLEDMMDKMGQRAKQKLWLHAWIHCSFNESKACGMIGISRNTLKSWWKDDDFKELVGELDGHKGNFFEGCLVNLCKRGDSAAIIFANKTFNKNRGYGDKLDINISSEVKVQHQLENEKILSKLSMAARLELLKVLKGEEAGLALEDQRDILDAEFEEKPTPVTTEAPK